MADVKWSEFSSGSAISGTDILVGLQGGDNVKWPFSAVSAFMDSVGYPISALTGAGTGILAFLANPTSGNLAAAVTGETGSGALVFATSPTLTTPTLGVATATSINKLAITAPATSATLTIADGKTLAASNSLTLTGTDGSSIAFGAGGTVLYNGGALGTPSSGTLTNCSGLPISGLASLGTGVGTALAVNTGSAGAFVVNGGALGTPASGTLTNCAGLPISGIASLGTGVATWLATPSSANLAAAVTDETGSGALVFATSPTLTTPVLGAATGTSLALTGALTAFSGTSIPAGGTAGSGLKFSSTANFGVFFGSGAPTLSAARGSVYLRSDGSSTTGVYTNTDGSTAWSALGGGGGGGGITIGTTTITSGTNTRLLYDNNGVVGEGVWSFDGSGNLMAATDGVYNIGANGSSRPKDIYASGAMAAFEMNVNQFYLRGGEHGQWDNGQMAFASTIAIKWSSTANRYDGTQDTGLSRSAAAVVKVTNGSSGSGVLNILRTTVSALPSASTVGAGSMAVVTDAATPTLGSAVTGSGSLQVIVVSDGTNWIVG